jgi:hypothetical protein
MDLIDQPKVIDIPTKEKVFKGEKIYLVGEPAPAPKRKPLEVSSKNS